MRKLKAGIVGCGGIANGKHLPAMKKSGLYEIVAFNFLMVLSPLLNHVLFQISLADDHGILNLLLGILKSLILDLDTGIAIILSLIHI